MKQNKIFTIIGIVTYLILLILISLFVFVANDDSLPINNILQSDYLIPVLIYSVGTLILCFQIYKLLSIKMARKISFPVSFVIGIPVGIMLVQSAFTLFTRLYM